MKKRQKPIPSASQIAGFSLWLYLKSLVGAIIARLIARLQEQVENHVQYEKKVYYLHTLSSVS